MAAGDPNPLDGVIAMITQDLDTSAFTDALRSLQSFLSTDPANILESAVTALVTAADAALELVLGVIKNIAQAVLDVVSEGIDLLRQALAVKIEVPIISWLFDQLFPGSGGLSISDIVTMGAAAVVTLLYELIFQKAPFKDSDVTSLLASAMPWPSAGAEGRRARSETPWDTLGKVLGKLSALIMPVNMFFETSLDTTRSRRDPHPGLETGLSTWSIALSFIGQGLGVPYEEIGAGGSMNTPPAVAALLAIDVAGNLGSTVTILGATYAE